MRQALPVAITLSAGMAGALVFYWIGAPAAFLVGSAVAVTGAVAARLPTSLPAALRDPALAILGVMMGAGVHPEALGALATIPLAVLGLILAITGATVASYVVLRQVGRWDPVTALCGSIPGALQVTMATAIEAGARMDRVVMAQALRLLILVSLVPLVFGGGDAPSIRTFSPPGADTLTVLVSVVIGVGSGYLGKLVKIPSAILIVPLCVSAILSTTGLVTIAIPTWLAAIAFVVLGASVAQRFDGMAGADILPALRISLLAFVAAFAAAVLVAAAFRPLLGEPLGAVFLAYAPGGVDAMIVLAFLLKFDVSFVAVLHVTRLLALSVGAPLVVAYVRRRVAGNGRAHIGG
ncbi:MAG: AbrB family transcriptional regulator [Pseudomonadota bacterium]